MILGDGEHVDSIASQSFAQGASSTDISSKRISLDFLNESVQIREGKGIAVGEVDLVIGVREGILPAECVERFILVGIFAITVFIVSDSLTRTMPT